jgi:hypothetical protein
MKWIKQTIPAIKFYKDIQEKKEISKYRLVNGGFIIRYINEEVSMFIGEFRKANSCNNPTKTNRVILNKSGITYLYNKNKNMATTSLGFWKPLRISFKEKPLKEILK